ncbi:Crp/Fnr family transcriptional regulator [beta proteobacterium AAP51]|nr:Crp/Fnr family transcriptional regulator [beta proteobacterium AAP51]
MALSAAHNLLIESLPVRDRARLLALCETVQLGLSEVLGEAGVKSSHVYFPTEGFISLLARVDEHPGLEVGMVGREGMVGTALLLGVAQAPTRWLVQGAGRSLRITAAAFRCELKASPALQRQLALYLYVVMAQMVSSAGCLRFHLVAQRLARWLLMSQDRAQASHFHVTHEILAYMLGVRRVGVTVAAGELQRRGLIHYHRGELTVTDRPGLEAAACSCYAADRAVYALHLG